MSGPVVQILSSSRGGAATHVLALATGLVRRGHQVYVAMPYDGGNLRARELRAAGIIPLRWDGGWRRLVQLLAPLHPATVHAHGSRAATWAWLALAWPSLWKTRLLYSLHGFVTPFHPQPRRALQMAVERAIARRATAVLCDARAERAEAVAQGLTTPDRAFTALLGFELGPWLALGPQDRKEARARLGLGPEDWFLLTVCRLDRPRDFATLLAALPGLPSRVRLGIVGLGPLDASIRGLAEGLGLSDRVQLFGLVDSTLPYYAAADAFVLTSWGWEGLPVTVIEAQAAGLPVVVSDAGGSKEAILPGESGLLVPRRDARSLHQALRQLLEDPGDMGARGRSQARERFQLERMVDDISRFL